jgi:hypothetical protein
MIYVNKKIGQAIFFEIERLYGTIAGLAGALNTTTSGGLQLF